MCIRDRINALRFAIGAYSQDDFDVQFAFDWMDDQSGVRGAQMLAPNRFVPTAAPMDSRYDVRNGMPNVNDTTLSGASVSANFKMNDDWSVSYTHLDVYKRQPARCSCRRMPSR